MKIKFLFCIFLIVIPDFIFSFSATEFKAIYSIEYIEATEKAISIYSKMLKNLDNNKHLAAISIAIIFPELVRFSYIHDVAETTTMEIAYIMGLEVDFSIGIFQIKPSFIEQLERDVPEEIKVKYNILDIKEIDLQKKRMIRLQQLKKEEYQLEYLAIFILFMHSKYPDICKDDIKAIRILATAYNSGFNKSIKELEYLSHCEYFPYGKNWPSEQFIYADISIDFYKTILKNRIKVEEK
jgi:hypothetical protein